MIELVLSAESPVRFGISPLEEALGAVQVMLGLRAHPAHPPWLTGTDLPIAELRAVLSGRRYITDFLSPPPDGPHTTAQAQLDRIRRTPPAQVTAELAMVDADLSLLPDDPARARDLLADQMDLVWTELVAPHWPPMRDVLTADIAYRSRRLADGGLPLALADLHRRVRLAGGSILVESRSRERVRLGGRGLLLLPAVFAWPGVGVVTVPPWQPALLYPARGVAGLWAAPSTPDDRLAKVFGRTKAAVLLALGEPLGTSTLATRLGLAASTVSEHLTALRDVGILTAARTGHEVRYRRSDLGDAILAGLGWG
ncbi:DUF5937 family protein [Amycolatopsis endophytica]|uniref:DNA-binding transcriptional ArsR family regulator n=1 Tax=Amycolatopsis endophytica TaxID=860233 RepID=A0A853B0Q8_9PSEU|nr:DUF5937 family protein [Amycolatopsis endophytica]NYI88653.1 DNA-binding transcriptional ArsR family regulator [Amycolatopsis endophytica]